jgi:SAM-dependent methyltransferase
LPAHRLAAEEFARQYAALRRDEGWVGPDGREDPRTGDPALWRGRMRLVSAVAAFIESERASRSRMPVIADIGSGGGWLADCLPGARVVSIDLLPSAAIRGDMRSLPLTTSSVDAVIYVASLHYAEPDETIPEAARVLVEGGLFIAVDSPVYPDVASRRKAAERSALYYRKRGFPDLAAHYHPLDQAALRTALASAGLGMEQFEVTRPTRGLWGRVRNGRPSCFVIARRLPYGIDGTGRRGLRVPRA